MSLSSSEWVSVNDSLPDDLTQVLVYTNHGYMFTARRAVIESKNSRPDDGAYERITHWMSMPSPPKELRGEVN